MGNYAGLIAAGVSAGSSIMGGQAAKKAGNASGDAEIAASVDEARKIRKLAKQTRSQATAAYAASGVDVSEGTPLIAERDITQQSEEDALNTILGGQRRARALRKGGQVGQRAGYLEAATTALYGGSKFASNGWTRAPAKGAA